MLGGVTLKQEGGCPSPPKEASQIRGSGRTKTGRGERIRTSDSCVPNAVLYQAELHPEVVFNSKEEVTVTLLDKLPIDKGAYNILAMDVQGYEGEVLKGATQTLQHIDVIYTEVNNGDTYKGCMLVEEMDDFLFDYQRVETYLPSPSWTWGDSVYIKKSLL